LLLAAGVLQSAPRGARIEDGGAISLAHRGRDQAALVTLPALRQRVQTRRRRCDPFTSARTRCRFGKLRFLVLLLAWDTWLPTRGPLPQRSHLNAIARPHSRKRNAGLCSKGPPRQVALTVLRPERASACPAAARAARICPSSPKPG